MSTHPITPAPPPSDAPTPTDFAAFAALLPTLRPSLLQLLRRHHLPTRDAEDILQTSLLALLQNWPHITDPAAYLHGIVRRQIARHFRAAERLTPLTDDHLAPHPAGAADDTDLDRRCEARRALARLPRPVRQVALLHYAADLSHAEIAAVLGQTPAAIRQTLSRGLRRLRHHLNHPPAPAAR